MKAMRPTVPARATPTAMEYPRHLCVHHLVEAQAARTPHAVAVESGDAALTYAELDARADALAARLRALGAGPESRVGIFLDRGAEMVVALLGVLKAGGAYVPLDPAFPRERLAYMLADSGAALLLTQPSLLEVLPDFGGTVVGADGTPLPPAPSPARGEGEHDRVRVGDGARPGQAPSPPGPLSPASGRKGESESAPEGESALSYSRTFALSHSLAYVIYTSGSTGRPKGVMIPHRAVVNFLHTMQDRPGLGADDVLVAVTTLSFDIAGLEIFLPLSVGARVVVASRETASDPRALAELLETSGATVLQATPATWRMLLASGWRGRPGLRALSGGEALDAALARRLRPLVGELWNLYGPTETTIWSTVQRVEETDAAPPIGGPVGNTRLHLLDEALDPVPLGVPGELYVAGEGVARGYFGRPDLTAERFLPERGGAPGERMYRTGDVARFRQDGGLEYLERADFQVKVRGFRIELGEVEAALAAHPGVGQAVVAAREDEPGDRRLVAYLVAEAQGEEAPNVGELRAWLLERLPEYMVPAAFVQLDAFPLTPNGKTDRRALPALDAARPAPARPYVAPRTALEEVIAAAWGEVLGAERVGVHDHFFELGGHSLNATQALARLEVLKVSLPPRAVFDAPTVEQMARLVCSKETVPGRTETIAGILRKVRSMSSEDRVAALRARQTAGGAP